MYACPIGGTFFDELCLIMTGVAIDYWKSGDTLLISPSHFRELANQESKGHDRFLDELCLLMTGFDIGQQAP